MGASKGLEVPQSLKLHVIHQEVSRLHQLVNLLQQLLFFLPVLISFVLVCLTGDHRGLTSPSFGTCYRGRYQRNRIYTSVLCFIIYIYYLYIVGILCWNKRPSNHLTKTETELSQSQMMEQIYFSAEKKFRCIPGIGINFCSSFLSLVISLQSWMSSILREKQTCYLLIGDVFSFVIPNYLNSSGSVLVTFPTVVLWHTFYSVWYHITGQHCRDRTMWKKY